MAAIEPSLRVMFTRRAVLAAAATATTAGWLPGAPPEDVRAVLIYVCSALANGNPADAMTVFSKSFGDYEKLARYFAALTNGFDVTSEVEITDRTDGETETEVEANWTLTLVNRSTSAADRRTRDVKIRFRKEARNKKTAQWKIVDLSSIELFNPQ